LSFFHVGFANSWLGGSSDASWFPNGSPETTRTGLFSIFLVGLLIGRRDRLARRLFWIAVAGVLLTSSLVYVQPWASRFSVPFLSLLSIAFCRECSRLRLGALVATMAVVLVGSVSLLTTCIWSFGRGGEAHQRRSTRAFIVPSVGSDAANSVGAIPVLLITESGTFDAEIAGVAGDTRFSYLTCPPDGNWSAVFRRPYVREHIVVVTDLGGPTFRPGPEWATRAAGSCGPIERASVDLLLQEGGWQLLVTQGRTAAWTYLRR
jgi:hypothetical protein